MNEVMIFLGSVLMGFAGLLLVWVSIIVVGKLTGTLKVMPASEDVYTEEDMWHDIHKEALTWWAIANRGPMD